LPTGLHLILRWRGIAALATIAAVAAGIGQTNVGHAMLRKVGLIERSTGYSALAFHRPTFYLPEYQQVTLGQKQTSFLVPFTIVNASGAPHNYRWSMLVIQEGRARREHAGSVHLLPGNQAERSPVAMISCPLGRARIVVSLNRPAETIEAWTACSSGRSRTS
jgi:hypothetical protein